MPAPPIRSRPIYLTALRVFRRMPAPLRRAAVRAGTPGFTVGAVCLLERDGMLLMLRQPHRVGWSLPGGLLDRGESAADAVQRELVEDRQAIDAGVEDLDEIEREVLRLRFAEDLTQSKIAEEVGYSQMHVSRILRRALAKLRIAAQRGGSI